MYGTTIGGPLGGAGATGALAATGFNSLALVVGVLTLTAAGLSLMKLAPRFRRTR
jgi:hypothetical protein